MFCLEDKLERLLRYYCCATLNYYKVKQTVESVVENN